MAYCSLSDIQALLTTNDLLDLTDDSGTGVINSTVVAACIAGADALIDGYLRGSYALPLTTVPALVKQISVNLSIFELYNRTKSLLVPEQLEKNRDFYINMLKDIARGAVTLDVTDAQGQTVGVAVVAGNKTSSDRVFTSDLLEAY